MPYRGRDKGYRAPKPKTKAQPYDERQEAVAEYRANAVAQPRITGYVNRGGKGYQGTNTDIPQYYYPPAPEYSMLPADVIESNPAPRQWANQVFNTSSYRNFRQFYNRALGRRSPNGQVIGAISTSAHDTSGSNPKTNPSARHGWHSQVMNQLINNGSFDQTQLTNESAGVTEPPPMDYVGGGGVGGYGGGYPWYDYGGGGGGSYAGYNNSFTRYRPGYAAQGSAAPSALNTRSVSANNPYRGYATQNQQARWLQRLISWKI